MNLTKGLAIQDTRVFRQFGNFANQKNVPTLPLSSSPSLKEKRMFSRAVLGSNYSGSLAEDQPLEQHT